jgi:hypothetical protein
LNRKYNATISYTLASFGLTQNDPITGEPIFSNSSTTESIRVSIEPDTTRANLGILPGKDITEHFYAGRLVEPNTLPSWYKAGATLDIAWDDNGKTGKFYVYPTMISRFGLESIFGQPISGVLLT